MPFRLQRVGAYWDRHTQVDVVAVGPEEQAWLLGEEAEQTGVIVLADLETVPASGAER